MVRYVIDMPVGQYNNGMIFGINKDLWEDMSAENKEAIVTIEPSGSVHVYTGHCG